MDVNSFVRKLVVKSHFHTQETQEECEQAQATDTSLALEDLSIHEMGELTDCAVENRDNTACLSFSDTLMVQMLAELESEQGLDGFERVPKNKNKNIMKMKNSRFYPVQARTLAVDNFQDIVQRELIELHCKTYKNDSHKHHNLSDMERKALNKLKNNRDITVRKADKGGSVVLLNTELYIKLNEAILNDVKTYTKLAKDPTADILNKLKLVLDEGKALGVLDQKLCDYIYVALPVIPVFHSLPKLHKLKFPPPMRPIVAGIGSANERLCEWVDLQLQPLVRRSMGFLLDTKHVLNSVQHIEWRPSFCWLTSDIESLYSVIPHQLALKAVAFHLEKYSDYDNDTVHFLLLAIEYLLVNNYFTFNNIFYIQRTGASMGAKFSPSLANLYVSWFEEVYVFTESNPFACNIVWYGRYIDDVIIIWNLDVTAIPEFISYLNHNAFGLFFTYEFDKYSIPFLDILLFIDKDASVIQTKTYRKSTASNSILHANSCHPVHTKRNIPVGEMLRSKRNCSDQMQYLKEENDIHDRLKKRRIY